MKTLFLAFIIAFGANSAYSRVMDCEDYACDSLAVIAILVHGQTLGSVTSLTEANTVTGVKRIYKLNLTEKGVTSLPPEIGNLNALTELHLGKNELTALPGEIAKLQSLDLLVLSFNSFSDFPKILGELVNLDDLIFTQNSLTVIPPEIGNLSKLTDLDLGTNAIKSLPTEFGNLTALNNLFLPNNELETLPESITALDARTRINGNKLCQVNSTIETWLNDYADGDWKGNQDCANPVIQPVLDSKGFNTHVHGNLLKVEATEPFSVSVSDLKGHVMLKNQKANNKFTVSTSDWHKGIYLLTVTSNSKTFTAKVIVN